jgi:hypothetical protein
MEMPGFILVVKPGEAWLRADGTVTCDWDHRGVWGTAEDAEAALEAM